MRRELVVDRQLVTVSSEPPAFAPPKTMASERVVPVSAVVMNALQEHYRRCSPKSADELVFTLDDNPITRSAFGHLWRPIAREVGIPAGDGLHALRHYYASLLIRHGESVKVVQARLGHASAAETLDTYSHLWPDSDDCTRDAVESELGDLADSVRTEKAV